MAATVNSRDLILQAATVRIEPITLPSNVTIDNTQVAGLGTVINNAFSGVEKPFLFWDFSNTLDGWTSGTTPTATIGQTATSVTWAPTVANAVMSRNLSASEQFKGSDCPKVRACIRRVSGSAAWEGNVYFTTSAAGSNHGSSSSFYQKADSPVDLSKWTIVEWDMRNLAAGGTDWLDNTITALRIDLSNTADGSVWEFDWIAVGRFALTVSPTDITAAMAAINNMSSDNVLSKGEKSQVILDWSAINAEKNGASGLDAQADAMGVSRTAYDDACDALGTYLTSLSPAYTDTTTDTTIVGSTFRTKFTDYYTAKQNLINALAAKAATMGDWNNLLNIPYSTILSNEDAVAMGFNPSFADWPTGGQRPTGWSGSGALVARETTIKRLGQWSVRFNTGGAMNYLNRKITVPAMPLGTFVAGTFDAYIDTINAANTTGKPGLKVRLWWGTNSTEYVDTDIALLLTAGSWQRTNFSARMTAGKQIVAIEIFLMAAFNTTKLGSSLFNGSVIYDNFRFALFDTSVDNTTISIGSDGTLGGAGGGKVTITGLGYNGDLDATKGAPTGTLVGGTAAQTVEANANAAKAAVDAIANDNLLSKGEKPQVILDWTTVSNEYQGLANQADALSVSRTAYDASYTALYNYIIGLSPAYTDLTQDTVIDGPTFRTKFNNYYNDKQNLLNAIGAVAATTANADGSIRTPGGGYYATSTSNMAGAIKIRLPQSWTNTMMKFTVDIFEYLAGYSCTLEIAGYNNTNGPQWRNVSAKVIGSSNVEYPVYFGHDGTMCCIWIGASTETWAYPQVRVRDFLAGFSNTTKDKWSTGWQISFDQTAAANVTASVLDTLPGADWSKSSKRPANLSSLTGTEPILNSAVTVAPNLVENIKSWSFTGGASTYEGEPNATDGRALTLPVGAVATSRTMNLLQSTDYTLSFKAKGAAAGSFSFDLYPDTLPEQSFPVTTSWQTFSVKWNSAVADMLSCKLRALGSSTVQVQITDIKLEKGATKTPWVDSVITSNNSKDFLAPGAIPQNSVQPTTLGVSLSDMNLTSQANTTTYQNYAQSAVVSGGTATSYIWSFDAEEGDIRMNSDPTASTANVQARGSNIYCSGWLTLTIKDAYGGTASDSAHMTIQFGSGVPK